MKKLILVPSVGSDKVFLKDTESFVNPKWYLTKADLEAALADLERAK